MINGRNISFLQLLKEKNLIIINNSELSVEIIGAIGGICGVIVITVIVIIVLCRRKRLKEKEEEEAINEQMKLEEIKKQEKEKEKGIELQNKNIEENYDDDDNQSNGEKKKKVKQKKIEFDDGNFHDDNDNDKTDDIINKNRKNERNSVASMKEENTVAKSIMNLGLNGLEEIFDKCVDEENNQNNNNNNNEHQNTAQSNDSTKSANKRMKDHNLVELVVFTNQDRTSIVEGESFDSALKYQSIDGENNIDIDDGGLDQAMKENKSELRKITLKFKEKMVKTNIDRHLKRNSNLIDGNIGEINENLEKIQSPKSPRRGSNYNGPEISEELPIPSPVPISKLEKNDNNFKEDIEPEKLKTSTPSPKYKRRCSDFHCISAIPDLET
jgi:hypothetical protein